MDKPLLHPTTKLRLDAYLTQPTHGLLLAGKPGTGKLYIAQWLAHELQSQSFSIKPLEDKKTITIEQIRELYGVTRTGSNLVVIVEDANTMSTDAQNSFLKLLEEPPKNTHFILTASSASSLLPTIRSRAQLVEVLPPARKDLLRYAKHLSPLDEVSLQSMLHTSEGLPGASLSLLQDENLQKSHQAAVAEAKAFYTADAYQRHLICLEHKYDKEWTEQLLRLLGLILQSLLKQTAGNAQTLKKLKAQAELLEQTSRNILSINGNPKIQLARLVTQLG